MRKQISTYLQCHIDRILAISASLIAFAIYFFTADSGVSYWDCPEYVLTASSLQVGHPPGNPVWTLAMRMATIPFPVHLHARVINICSGLLMAGAVFFLARIIYRMIRYVMDDKRTTGQRASWASGHLLASAVAAIISLCFAVLDSTWFSAVEAEVYAFSTFLTLLTIWLMAKWAEATATATRNRWLILTAYILGLSLGVHQLNLLVLPVAALIFTFRRHPHGKATLKAWSAIAISFILVAVILLGLMPGAVEWCALLELLCVNHFELPYFTGVLLYPVIMAGIALLSIIIIPKTSKITRSVIFTLLLWISGLFLFGSHLLIALCLSAVTAVILVRRLSPRALLTSAWMLIMLWLGYSAIALILIRGYAAPPVNEGSPGDLFSLQRYISREQYGSKPLFYGATPFSRPMYEERIDCKSGRPDYSRYALRKEKPRYFPATDSPSLVYRSRLLSHTDSMRNMEIAENGHGYILADYSFSRRSTPELDMWFPRITSGSHNMLKAYADWAGMTEQNMKQVEITTAIDSTGNAVGKMLASGEREVSYAKRPTYLQNLRYFLTYQVSYMYLRYLLWNFVGRQNDIPSTGEIDHGNVITGFTPLDRIMTGDERLMPQDAGPDNPGRHTYYAIPFLIGIIGMIWLLNKGRRGKRVMAVITVLFLMTGVAIVVYLNQNPGEPRERDYAFIASYMAFCIWMAFGLVAIAGIVARATNKDWLRLPVAATCGCLLFLWYLIENYPDHDRSGRFHTRAFALNTLTGKEKDIIFSYGDNFTFPLWYAQEVEGAASNATIVDLSYLATPEYVVNLMRQGDKGLKLTATPSDITYGAYAFTRIAPEADTVPRKLIDILRELYARQDGSPTLHHSKAIIPGRTLQDSLVLNLKSLATVSGMIPFRTLMLLDIIATNLEQPEPRPLSFLNSVRSEVMAPVRDALLTEAFSDTYAPHMGREEYRQRLRVAITAIDSTSRIHNHDRNFTGHHVYTDPVINDQIRRQRGAFVRAAGQLAAIDGNTYLARWVITRFPDLYPEISPGYYSVADTAFHEGLEAAELMLSIGNNVDAARAKCILKSASRQAYPWKNYYESLPAGKRHTVSNESRRLITTIPRIERLKAKADSIDHDPILERSEQEYIFNNYETTLHNRLHGVWKNHLWPSPLGGDRDEISGSRSINRRPQ